MNNMKLIKCIIKEIIKRITNKPIKLTNIEKLETPLQQILRDHPEYKVIFELESITLEEIYRLLSNSSSIEEIIGKNHKDMSKLAGK